MSHAPNPSNRPLPLCKLLVAAAFVCALWPSTALAAAADCDRSPIFKTAPEYAAGSGASSVAAGDFNNDGVTDFAVANLRSSSVSILIGDGAGGFGPPLNLTVPQDPNSVAVGDFNKDGKPDVVVGHFWGGGRVSLLFGQGGGQFAPAVIVPNITGHHEVAVGDFNGDTNPDVAVGVVQANPRILLGDGAGNFTVVSLSGIGNDSRFLAVGEFNGDGINDIAFAVDTIPDEVVIVLGNAGGNFTAGDRVDVGQSPKGIAARDFNGDGRDDLVVTVEHFEPRLLVLLNDGTGNFSQTSHFVTSFGPGDLTTADFNADGKADVAALAGGRVQVFLGNGLGGFTETNRQHVAGKGPQSLVAGDFNADGHVDLAAAAIINPMVFLPPTGAVAVLLGDGAGNFDAARAYKFSSSIIGPVAVGDFNNNGRSDLAVGFAFSPFVLLSRDDGAGGVAPFASQGAGNYPVALAAADFNADGNLDLAAANSNSSFATVFFGVGTGELGPAQNIEVGTGQSFVAAGNFNGDNRADLVLVNTNGRVNVILSNNANGFFIAPGSPFDAAPNLAVGDFNGDGRDDLAAASSPQNTVSIWLNDGTGRMTAASSTPIPVTDFTELRLAAADLNSDGRVDLVSANGEEHNVTVFLGDGAGGLGAGTNFASGASNSISYRPLDLAIADFDGDGHPDVVVANNDFAGLGEISVLLGNGAGALGEPINHPTGSNPFKMAVGDFNGDTRPDIAVSGGQAVTLLLNTYAPLPCLSVGDTTVTEGDAGTSTAEFTVSLSAASAETVRVNYTVRALTATAGADFTPTQARLVFAPGETSKTVSVPVVGDLLNEPDETFELVLASPSNAALNDALGLGTITNNDPLPTISINDVTVTENTPVFGTTAQFTVTLSAPSGKTVTVQYNLAGGTATPDLDFSVFNLPGTLTFQPGQTTATVNVTIRGDDIFEPDETFFVNLSNPTNAELGDAQGQATITNDDTAPTVSVEDTFAFEGNSGAQAVSVTLRLSNPTSQAVTVNYATADGTAVAGTDYTASSGTVTINPEQLTTTFTVTFNGDTLDEVDKTFKVNISNATGATIARAEATVFILDDDGPALTVGDVSVTEGNAGTTAAVFTLTLSAASPQNVGVRLSTASGTATGGTDYQSRFNVFVTIPAGSTSGTFTVQVVGDNAAEPDENFFVNLSNPSGLTLADTQAVGTILDDDATRVRLSAETFAAPESAHFAQITVERTGDTTAASTVNYATTDGTASERSDYITSLGTISFAPGETSKTFLVLVTDDVLQEGAEHLTLTLSAPTGATLGVRATATLTIEDDDAAPPSSNPIDGTQFFVRQHYHDFLNREPDAGGLAFWSNEIEQCGTDQQCREVRRINVSAAFFLSIEFQSTGYQVIRFYKATFPDSPSRPRGLPRYREFLRDTQEVQRGVVVGVGDWAQRLQENTRNFARRWVDSAEFTAQFPANMTAEQFVDKLFLNSEVTPTQGERDAAISAFGAGGTEGRANALLNVTNTGSVYNKQYNAAFVLMQYIGYLRRSPDDLPDTGFGGFNFWLAKLDEFSQPGEDVRNESVALGRVQRAEMIKAFISSIEYRRRFAP